MNNFFKSFSVYFRPGILHITLLGIASGLPFSVIFGTLTFWLSENDIKKSEIGLFALVGLPYVFKFIWSPFVDNLDIKWLTKKLGKRRSWIIITQVGLLISIIALGFSNPSDNNIFIVALLAIIVATISATQDIVIDGYRIECLKEEEQGAGAAAIVFGWRIGALISGAGTLFIAAEYDWHIAYLVTASIYIPIILYMLKLEEPEHPPKVKASNYTEWIEITILRPFKEFMTRDKWILTLIFILFFKLGDAIALSMLSPFIESLGYSKVEFASVSKLFGFAALMSGAMIGGALIAYIGIIKSLLFTGICQMLSTLCFVWLANVDHNIPIFTISIALENFASGMGTSAFVAFLSQSCNRNFTATQYALFSAFASLGKTLFAAPAGFFVEEYGWQLFFWGCTFLAIPGLLLIYFLELYRDKSDIND